MKGDKGIKRAFMRVLLCVSITGMVGTSLAVESGQADGQAVGII